MHRENFIAIFWDNSKVNFFTVENHSSDLVNSSNMKYIFTVEHRSSDLVNSSNIKYIFSSVGEGLPCKWEEMFG